MNDEEGLAWYAAAAAAAAEESEEEEEEGEEGEEEAAEEAPAAEEPEGVAQAAEDPYLAEGLSEDPYLVADPYTEAVVDPYGDVDEAPSEPPVPERVAAALAAAFSEEPPPPIAAPASDVESGSRPAASAETKKRDLADVAGQEPVADATEDVLQEAQQGPPALKAPRLQADADEVEMERGMEEEPRSEAPAQTTSESQPGPEQEAPELAPRGEEEHVLVPEAEGEAAPGEDVAMLDLPEGGEGEDVWDARVLVVRQGQVHIEIQHRKPPMRDATLLRFCDWLDQQLPLVVSNFPYVRKSGAYVDLSDNIIGPEGLDKLFRVLRDHRVPCVVMKAYRNVLNDSIVDTLIEYLYTQPESFPMHGIHISHNNISDRGALRLVRAASLCGHYPRLTSRLPLWLRLEANDIQNPYKFLADCQKEGFNVCLMGNGLCSRPNCNHYSGVHVQLPYFLNQGMKGQDQYNKERSVAKAHAPPLPALPAEPSPSEPAPPALPPAEPAAPETTPEAEGAAEAEAIVLQEDETEEAMPDWKRKEKLDVRACLMVPAPKNSNFRPAPKLPSRKPKPPAPRPAAPANTTSEKELGEVALQLLAAMDQQPTSRQSLGMQKIARPPLPAALDGSEQPPPPAGAPELGAQLAALGTSPKAASPHFIPAPRAPVPALGYVPQSDSRELDGWRGTGSYKGKGRGGGPRGGSKGGWKESGGRGGKGVAKWGGGSRMWQGPTLQSKAKKDVRIEGELSLGFQWRFFGEGHAPKVLSVDFGSKVSEVANTGDSLLRVNGLDTSMFSERQIGDMLKQRPLSLRFGDE